MSKRLYIAYTGGTIGMKRTLRGYEPLEGFLGDYLKSLPELTHPDMPDYVLGEYAPLLDSANMSPKEWQIIAQDIASHYEDYDGFIILHGTDTMSYSASALSFMLEGLGKPVIFTGSQIPLSELRSDGLEHLITTMLLAIRDDIHEVCLYFNGKLLRANRSTKLSAISFDAFASPNYPLLAEVGVNITIFHDRLLRPKASNPFRVQSLSDCKIGSLRLFPGISARFVENVLLEPLQGLILESYGTGNAPNDPKLHQVLAEASARGVVIVNCTQCLNGRVIMSDQGYATGSALTQAGVISGADMTPEAALGKLIYLFSKKLTSETIRQAMQQNLRGELSP
ncbi:MAG: asparaginase [Deinococcales bacterium]